MPVLVIADLHLDLWLQAGRDPLAAFDPECLAALDALIVAGDLSNKPKVRWPHMLRHLGRYVAQDRIHIVPGNHDYYGHALDGEARLASICNDFGAHFAQKAEIAVGGTRFLCCTLWTDFALHGKPAEAMAEAGRVMNDYRYIRHIGSGYRRIRPQDTALAHADHRAWLRERLAAFFPGQTIVVTHHCPHPDLIGEKRSDLDPAYGSDLLPLIEAYQPEGWLFGHTHYRVDARVGRTFLYNVSLACPWQVEPGDEAAILLRGLVKAHESEGLAMMRARAARGKPSVARHILSRTAGSIPP